MFEKIFAATMVAGCLVLLLRIVLGTRRRARFDKVAGRWSRGVAAAIDAVFAWPSARRRARREAEAAIRRAQQGEWDGNVYRPKSFKDKRKLH